MVHPHQSHPNRQRSRHSGQPWEPNISIGIGLKEHREVIQAMCRTRTADRFRPNRETLGDSVKPKEALMKGSRIEDSVDATG